MSNYLDLISFCTAMQALANMTTKMQYYFWYLYFQSKLIKLIIHDKWRTCRLCHYTWQRQLHMNMQMTIYWYPWNCPRTVYLESLCQLDNTRCAIRHLTCWTKLFCIMYFLRLSHSSIGIKVILTYCYVSNIWLWQIRSIY